MRPTKKVFQNEGLHLSSVTFGGMSRAARRLWGVPSRFEIGHGRWKRVAPLIPPRKRRRRYPGRKAIGDRLVLDGILACTAHRISPPEDLPASSGYRLGVTCWWRRDWEAAAAWDALHQELLIELNGAGAIGRSRAAVD
jgi:transposase